MKCTSQWVFICSELCHRCTVQFQNILSTSLKKAHPLAIPYPSPLRTPSPRQQLIYLLSMHLPVLDIPCERNHTLCGLWCPAPVTAVFPGPIHVLACVSALSLLMAESRPTAWKLRVPCVHSRSLDTFCLGALRSHAAANVCASFCTDPYFSPLGT